MITDVSEGSRLEISGITTMADAVKAITDLYSKGMPVDTPFHCYLRADGTFSVWAEWKGPE